MVNRASWVNRHPSSLAWPFCQNLVFMLSSLIGNIKSLNVSSFFEKRTRGKSELSMTQNSTHGLLFRVKEYVKENLGAPFIVGFMLLLIVAAVSLSAGWSSLADTVAIYAFYALVVGVVLQLVCFLKYPRKDDNEAV